MKKKICILGSTGSIGKSTLDIILKNKKNFDVILLSGHTNYKLLISQAIKFKPKYIYSNNFFLTKKIKSFCKYKKIIIINDLNLLKKIKFDVTISAISGIDGMLPTLNIIKFSKKILIANKESIICGWKFIFKQLNKYNCTFIPIDSEHYSISNLIENKNRDEIKYIYLPASGGPFFGKKINLNKVTPAQATKHPKWKMGKKISVDSANLMNKVLEVIEASLIFNLPINKFRIVIHPQSLVHAIVEFKNGLSTMLYHYNDMKIPIHNSLIKTTYCHNNKLSNKFYSNTHLSFHGSDTQIFPSLKILRLNKVLNETGFIIINVVNEILVKKFLRKEIYFSEISLRLLSVLKSKLVKYYLKNNKICNIRDVLNAYNFSRSLVY